MIDETKQQTAIDYVFGELPPADAIAFEKELASDEELREFTRELREGVAALALEESPVRPDAGLFSRILTRTNGGRQRRPKIAYFLPWTVAACLALAALVAGLDDFRNKQEVAELNRRDVIAHLQIASLRAQINTYAKSSAIVVWNAARQRGLIRLQDLPSPEAGRDYQLWIIDPAKKAPVSAGVVPTEKLSSGEVEFRPASPITSAAKFALSIEKTGGSPEPQGQIILVGD
jgi:anti-sigma-K factor RskA